VIALDLTKIAFPIAEAVCGILESNLSFFDAAFAIAFALSAASLAIAFALSSAAFALAFLLATFFGAESDAPTDRDVAMVPPESLLSGVCTATV